MQYSLILVWKLKGITNTVSVLLSSDHTGASTKNSFVSACQSTVNVQISQQWAPCIYIFGEMRQHVFFVMPQTLQISIILRRLSSWKTWPTFRIFSSLRLDGEWPGISKFSTAVWTLLTFWCMFCTHGFLKNVFLRISQLLQDFLKN